MRCYLMRKGHIVAVELLKRGSDESLIEQGKTHFRQRSGGPFDGFEVWDSARRLYVHPNETDQPTAKIEDARRHAGGRSKPVIVMTGNSIGTKADIHCSFEFRGHLLDLSVRNAEVGERLDRRQAKARQLIVDLSEALITTLNR